MIQAGAAPRGAAGAPIQVMMADDHPIVRQGLVNEFARHRDICVLAEASNGDDLLEFARNDPPDVVLLDIHMPGMGIMGLLAALAALPAPPQVIILTADQDPELVMTMLKAGVKGYVLKSEEPRTIAAVVRTVARGEVWMSSAVLTSVVSQTVGAAAFGHHPNLTSREWSVLRLTSEGKDNHEIGAELLISERTVRFHLRNIYDKLGVSRRSGAISWGVRHFMSAGYPNKHHPSDD